MHLSTVFGGFKQKVEHPFFDLNFISIKIRKNITVDDYVFYLYVLKKQWKMGCKQKTKIDAVLRVYIHYCQCCKKYFFV